MWGQAQPDRERSLFAINASSGTAYSPDGERPSPIADLARRRGVRPTQALCWRHRPRLVFTYLWSWRNGRSVNFWQPSGTMKFQALQPGELFLFKLHSPNNYIVGGGVFAQRWNFRPVPWRCWKAFGEEERRAFPRRNAATGSRSIGRRLSDPHVDYQIGCRLWSSRSSCRAGEVWIPFRSSGNRISSWAKARIRSDEEDGRDLLECRAGTSGSASRSRPADDWVYRASIWRISTLIEPRLGQGTFRISVIDTYERRCAVTGERTLPILDAAHIRPFGDPKGGHRVQNGLLLRTDIHRLFDRGYADGQRGSAALKSVVA